MRERFRPRQTVVERVATAASATPPPEPLDQLGGRPPVFRTPTGTASTATSARPKGVGRTPIRAPTKKIAVCPTPNGRPQVCRRQGR